MHATLPLLESRRFPPLRREAALSLVGTALKSRLYARSSSPNATILDMELSLIERRSAMNDAFGKASRGIMGI